MITMILFGPCLKTLRDQLSDLYQSPPPGGDQDVFGFSLKDSSCHLSSYRWLMSTQSEPWPISRVSQRYLHQQRSSWVNMSCEQSQNIPSWLRFLLTFTLLGFIYAALQTNEKSYPYLPSFRKKPFYAVTGNTFWDRWIHRWYII